MSAAVPAEVRELLDVVLAAIDIPYPATLGDTARHHEVLAERVMHATITLRQVLATTGTPGTDLARDAAYLGRPSAGRLQHRALARYTSRRQLPGHPRRWGPMTRLSCLFCGRPIGPGEPRCPAFERAGVAAHQRCCGCQGWAGWTRPGQALPPAAEEACR